MREDTFDVMQELTAGGFVIIASRPGMGKTALAMQIATGFTEQTGREALIFSPRLSFEQYINRIASQFTGIDGYRIEHGPMDREELKKFEKVIGRIKNLPVQIDDSPSINAGEICEKMATVRDLGLVVIDPADDVFGERGGSSELEMLKSAARDAGVAIICCCRIPRSVEERKDKRSTLTDLFPKCLRDADVVIFPYRESYYDPLSGDNSAEIRVVNKRDETYVLNAAFGPAAVKFDIPNKSSP